MNFNNYLNRDHAHYMEIALKAAEEAKSRGDQPIGAVLVFANETTISDSDTVFTERNYTNHAEMNVLHKASQTMFRKLRDSVLYSTVEPCIMCSEAARLCGIKEIIFGAYDIKEGFLSSGKMGQSPLAYKGGVMACECRNLLPHRLLEQTRELPE